MHTWIRIAGITYFRPILHPKIVKKNLNPDPTNFYSHHHPTDCVFIIIVLKNLSYDIRVDLSTCIFEQQIK